MCSQLGILIIWSKHNLVLLLQQAIESVLWCTNGMSILIIWLKGASPISFFFTFLTLEFVHHKYRYPSIAKQFQVPFLYPQVDLFCSRHLSILTWTLSIQPQQTTITHITKRLISTTILACQYIIMVLEETTMFQHRMKLITHFAFSSKWTRT